VVAVVAVVSIAGAVVVGDAVVVGAIVVVDESCVVFVDVDDSAVVADDSDDDEPHAASTIAPVAARMQSVLDVSVTAPRFPQRRMLRGRSTVRGGSRPTWSRDQRRERRPSRTHSA
jgi:hypothetical protein